MCEVLVKAYCHCEEGDLPDEAIYLRNHEIASGGKAPPSQ